MSDDPYQILGVVKDASQADIQKAYRKLAKELHPDINPGNAEAEERFKKVTAAYHLLKDPEQRARFDRGEIDASGAERPEHTYYRQYGDAGGGGRYYTSAGFEDFVDVSDLFSGMFGEDTGRRRTMRMRGQDAHYRLEVDFLDAVNGAKRRITLADGNTLDLTIPAGMRDGGTLRLKGKGGEGFGGGPAGDALVEITVKPHPVFRRQDDDIVIELPITLDEAVLGAKVEVPTISGRVKMTVPGGASSGDTLRLRGKGVAPAKRQAGDQQVILKVVLPEAIDGDLETFMKDWRETHQYDPRAALRRAV